MNIAVIGGGGREHAIISAVREYPTYMHFRVMAV